MDLQSQTKKMRYLIRREKIELEEIVQSSLEKAYQWYCQLYKEVNDHLAKNVFTLDLNEFENAKLDGVCSGFVVISKEINDFWINLKDKQGINLKFF